MDYPRDTPLDVCPDLRCRRSGNCWRNEAKSPCLRFFMDPDDYCHQLAAKLEALYEEWTGKSIHDPRPEPTPEEVAYLYNCLREREAEFDREARRRHGSANISRPRPSGP